MPDEESEAARDLCHAHYYMVLATKRLRTRFSSYVQGTLCELHYQIGYPQAKLVRLVQGEVFGVAVDLRKGSSTHGKWKGLVLSAKNHCQLFMPRGFAHGFLALTDATFCCKCDDMYLPGDEGGLIWGKPAIGIE